MQKVSIWEKLKLQIDNLEKLYQIHKKGEDVSLNVYWQVEYLNELLQNLESIVGADEVRKRYDSMPD